MKLCTKYDVENQRVQVTYSIIGDITRLKESRFQALEKAERYEKQLIKKGGHAELH